MPIYAYQCRACGHDFELMQKMSDPTPSICPSCGQGDIRKQLNAAGFQLKGKGWYATDFKGGSKKGGDKEPVETTPKAGGCGNGGCGSCGTH